MKHAAASLLAVLLLAATACERVQSSPRADDGRQAPAQHAAEPAAAAEPTPAHAPADPASPTHTGGGAAAGANSSATTPEDDAAVVYLDVRTPGEFADGHVQGTLHIPIDDLGRRWQELEPYRDRQIVVYCRTGRRAAAAIDLLAARGFSRLENGGGLPNMAARGLVIAQ